MAVLIAANSKATPNKVIAYILDPGKVERWSCQNLDPGISVDSDFLAQQMLDTQHLYKKGYGVDERKYYHFKLSFHPDDRVEKGGNLTPDMAIEIGQKVTSKFWPDRETVYSVHGDSNARHLHFVVNAVSIMDGKKLDIRDKEWCKMKDYCQKVCAEYGLKELDWRQATLEKRERDRDSDDPIKETYAEQGLRNRGEYCWKDELRGRIDFALKECKSMDEFKSMLTSLGVELPRCTDKTISYQMGLHKACRGDNLGGDYTIAAVKDALKHNAKRGQKNDLNLEDKIKMAETGADVNRVITQQEYERILQLGRLAGMKRTEIDAMCDLAPMASWDEKQAFWRLYKQGRDAAWEEWRRREQDIKYEISQAYWRKQAIRDNQWLMTKNLRKHTLIGLIFILICVTIDKKMCEKLDRDIAKMKRQQADIRREAAILRSNSQRAVEILRKKGLTKGEYMDAVFALQRDADVHWSEYEAKQPQRKEKPKQRSKTVAEMAAEYQEKMEIQWMLQDLEMQKRIEKEEARREQEGGRDIDMDRE